MNVSYFPRMDMNFSSLETITCLSYPD